MNIRAKCVGGGTVKLKPGKGKKGSGPPPKKVSVQDMIAEIRAKFDISDEEALYIKEVTEEKFADPVIRSTVTAHREDRVYLEGAYRGQSMGRFRRPTTIADATRNWPTRNTPTPAASSTSWRLP